MKYDNTDKIDKIILHWNNKYSKYLIVSILQASVEGMDLNCYDMKQKLLRLDKQQFENQFLTI